MEEPAPQISPYAYLFSAAFMIWMLVDAWRRKAPPHWYFIIVVMPFGAIFYFVMIKLRSYHEAKMRSYAEPNAGPPSEFVVGTAALPMDLDRADALEEGGQYAAAEPLYRAALEADASNGRALYGLGCCLFGAGKPTEALPHFERLLELDRSFADYGAALTYADALWAANQKSDAIELLERLADVTGRINHRLALGHYLAEYGQLDRAQREVERALEEAQGPKAVFSERQRQWVERGHQMLEEWSQSSELPSNDEN
jgi:hypothetical protein